MDDEVLGFITLFAGNFAPLNWAFCNGSLLLISSNTGLFSIIGNVYGGDGINNFALPDLRGRAVAGAGIPNYDSGNKGGSESLVPLQIKNIPAHTHPVQVTITPHAAGVANSLSPLDAAYATNTNQQVYDYSADVNMAPYTAKITTSTAGIVNPEPLAALHPVLALNYIICLRGTFPPRG